jgi:hypothetical protein
VSTSSATPRVTPASPPAPAATWNPAGDYVRQRDLAGSAAPARSTAARAEPAGTGAWIVAALAMVAVLLAWWGGLTRSPAAARPRGPIFQDRSEPRRASNGGRPSGQWSNDAAVLSDVRDAMTGAGIDGARPVYQCRSCKVYYQDASYAALRAENAGRCLGCGGTEIRMAQTRSW